MADLKKILFKRSNIAGSKPPAADMSEGELAMNLADSALYTKYGNDVIQLSGKGIPVIDAVDGTFKNLSAGKLFLDAGSPTSPAIIVKDTTAVGDSNLNYWIRGKTATSDYAYIAAGANSVDSGYLELGTGDNANEAIQVVQRDNTGSIKNKTVLMTPSGDADFGKNVNVQGNSLWFGQDQVGLIGTDGNGVYFKYNKTVPGVRAPTIRISPTGELTYNGAPIYHDGRRPTKAEIGLGNVDDFRQLRQFTFRTSDPSTGPRYCLIASLKTAPTGVCGLDLMVTGGYDSGERSHTIDFLTLSGRDLSGLTSSNVLQYASYRRIGGKFTSAGNPVLEVFTRYGVVKRTDADGTIWMDVYAVIPRWGGTESQVAVLSETAQTGYVNVVTSGNDKGLTQPAGFMFIPHNQIFDKVLKAHIDNDTQGTLPVSRGGTGAVNAPDARNNLGLGTAAVRDVGENNGNVLTRGAFGLGGYEGAGNIAKGSLPETMKYLATRGSSFFRVEDNIDVIKQYSPSIYVRTGSNQFVLSADHRTSKLSFVVATTTDGTGLSTGEVYTTLNKPSPSDVNAVSKTGDTMTGDLIIQKNAPLFALNSTNPNSNAVLYYRGPNSSGAIAERATIYANPSNEVRIRVRDIDTQNNFYEYSFNNTGEVSANRFKAGNAVFGNDGNITGGSLFDGNLNTYISAIKTTADNAVRRSGDTMTGRLNVYNDGGNSVDPILHIRTNAMHTPLLLERKTSANISIGFRLNDGNTYLLGVDTNRDLRYGTIANQSDNALVLTSDNLDKPYNRPSNTVRNSPLFEAMYGGAAPKPPTGTTPAANDYGYGVKMYDVSNGNTDGHPFNLGMIVSAKVNANRNLQFFGSSDDNQNNKQLWYRSIRTTTNSSDRWDRIAFSTMRNDFSALQVFRNGLNSDGPIRVNSNIGIGVNASTSIDPTITFAAGSTIREGTGAGLGALVFSSGTATGSVNYISFRPQNAGSSAVAVTIEADATVQLNSTNVEAGFFANNVRFRSGGTSKNELWLEANSADMFLRPRRGSDTNGFVISNATGSILQNAAQGTETNALTRRDFVVSQVNTRLPLAGGTMTGNITMGGSTQVINATAPTADSHLTNKAYVDKAVKGAIDGAGDTYLPLAGGTVKGTLTVDTAGAIEKKGIRTYTQDGKTVNETDGIKMNGFGDQYGVIRYTERVGDTAFIGLQTHTSASDGWFEFHNNGKFVANNIHTSTSIYANGSISGGGVTSRDGNFTCQAPQPGLNTNYWFRDSAGRERGVIWSNGSNGDMVIRNQSGRELVFGNDGWLILSHLAPNPTDTYNVVRGMSLRRGDTVLDNFNEWRANQFVRAGWHFFNSGGVDQWLTISDAGLIFDGSAADLRVGRNGSFDNVEIRSDRRSKNNIVKIENALDKVCTLTGNTYDLNHKDGTSSKSAGLIAQEVQEVLPEAVTSDNDEDALLRLNYNAVIALLVESVKELKAEVEELKSKQ
ncbi:tail fiber distal subunit [Klebsiella phage Metamorpho]|nr:tail fiber distal subunit [Klebsiella phage Metamorpho]